MNIRLNKLLPLLTLSVGLVATYFLQQAAITSSHKIQRDEFDSQVREVELRIQQRMEAYRQVLRGAEGLFAASKSVERDEFREYVSIQRLSDHYPGIQGVGFSLSISPAEKARHIASIRKEGFPKYTIRPEGERDLYTSIVYLEPFSDRNLKAFGFDMYSEAVRRAAMEQARDSDFSTISGKVKLVQENNEKVQSGFLMYLPIYRNGPPHETLADRRANIIGWSYSPFRMNDLMQGILGEQLNNIDLEIYDGKTATPETLMFDSNADLGIGTHTLPLFQTENLVEIINHNWKIKIHSLPNFDSKNDTGRVYLIRLTGILLSTLMAWLAWLLISGRERALNLAKEMTNELNEREQELTKAQLLAQLGSWSVVFGADESKDVWTISKELRKLYGYSDNLQVEASTGYELMPPEDQVLSRRYWSEAKQGKGVSEWDHRVIVNGETRWMHVTVNLTFDAEGKALTASGTNQDITERKTSEIALRESEARWQFALEGSGDGIWDWNAVTNQVFFSHRWKEMLGHADEEVGNGLDEWDKRVHPDDKAQCYADLDKHFRGETEFYANEHRVLCKDGSYKWILDRGKVIEWQADGKPLRVIGTHTDITDRKLTEQSLLESEARFRQMFERHGAVMLLIEPSSGLIVEANPAAVTFYGYAQEILCGMLINQINIQTEEDIALERAQALKEERNYFVFEHRLADGQIRTVEVHSSPVNHAGRNLLFSIIHDVTERKNAEAERNRLLAIIMEAPDFIATTDMQGRLLFLNNAGAKVVGLPADFDLSKLEIKDFHSDQATKRVLEEGVPTVLRQGYWQGENTLLHRDGHEFPVSQLLMVHRDSAGNPLVLSTIMRDITEIKQEEAELLRSNAELEQFSYAVSHDMRQPLRMISSYLQLLEMSLGDQLDSEKRGFFNFAIDGAKRIDQMLTALLEYSRVGRMLKPHTLIESRTVLDETLQFLQPAIAEAQAKLSITGEWPSIKASHDEIQRLLQNLIGNATKYRIAGQTPEITLISKVVNHEWLLCVTDNGVGIIPDQIPRLFKVFQRLQTRDAYEGTGVGLALCRKIVEHHKGRIWVESAGEGMGSQFYVMLPISSVRLN